MNTERLLALADVIERTPHREIVETYAEEAPAGFNMGTWHCGAVCCIGGWAEAMFVLNKRHRADVTTAAWALGLDELTADRLFYPGEESGWDIELSYDDITPVMAAVVIRDLAQTGSVHWSLATRMIRREEAA